MAAISKTLSVYFDGLCPLCSREIGHYRKAVGNENISFVDITHVDFNTKPLLRNKDKVMRNL